MAKFYFGQIFFQHFHFVYYWLKNSHRRIGTTWWIWFVLIVIYVHICIYFYWLTAAAYDFVPQWYNIFIDIINIAYIWAIKFVYLATANGKGFFYVGGRFGFYIHNQWCDEVIVTAFYEIIQCPFATSFAYTICQGRFGLNTKLCSFYICRFNFSFSVAVHNVSDLVLLIVNCKSSRFIGINIYSNIGPYFYLSFPHLAHVFSVESNMRWQFWLTFYSYSLAKFFIYL